MILENPNFLTHKLGNQETIKQCLEMARNLNKDNKTLDEDFISLKKAIVSNTEEEAKMKDKNVTQQNEICVLKKDVFVTNEKLLDLKEQLRLRKMAEKEKNEKLLRNTNLVETAIQSYFARFGLKTKIQQLEKEHYKFKISISENSKNLSLIYDFMQESFTLHSMQPSPLNIKKIKNLLEESNDISGFLYGANKYFDRVLNN